ncbi:MAG: tail fiber protein [Oceanicaulis sp.]
MKLRMLLSACVAGAALTAGVSAPAAAEEDPLLGQLRMFGGNFCPRHWTKAEGQLMPINQNQALYSLLGTQFGGNGTTTFALPDLRGRTPIGRSQSQLIGQMGGSETHTMTVAEMPPHTHNLNASDRPGTRMSPTGSDLAEFDEGTLNAYTGANPDPSLSMASGTVGMTGGGQAFPIRTPYTAITWCIALQGTFPQRN